MEHSAERDPQSADQRDRGGTAESVRAEADRGAAETARVALDETLATLPDSSEGRAKLDALRAKLAADRSALAACQSERDRLGREEAARNQRLSAMGRERQEWRERAERATARLDELDARAATVQATLDRLSGEPARLAEARAGILSELEAAEKADGT